MSGLHTVWLPGERCHAIRGGLSLLVCGLRTLDAKKVQERISELIEWYGFRVRTVIHGGQHGKHPELGIDLGADFGASCWALENDIRQFKVPAEWDKHGKAAGPIRNQEMLELHFPDLILAFWDGKSKGTGDMVRRAMKFGTPVLIEPAEGLEPDTPSAPPHLSGVAS